MHPKGLKELKPYLRSNQGGRPGWGALADLDPNVTTLLKQLRAEGRRPARQWNDQMLHEQAEKQLRTMGIQPGLVNEM